MCPIRYVLGERERERVRERERESIYFLPLARDTLGSPGS